MTNVNNNVYDNNNIERCLIMTSFQLWNVLFSYMPAMLQVERTRFSKLTKAESFLTSSTVNGSP